MTDNGAKALAERLHEEYQCVVVGHWNERDAARHDQDHQDEAARILATGSVFLTAEEAEQVEQLRTRLGDCDEALTTVEVAYHDHDDEIERLRRIETAAGRVTDAMQTVRATSENFAEEPRNGDAKTFWLMARDEADEALRALRAALTDPEPSHD